MLKPTGYNTGFIVPQLAMIEVATVVAAMVEVAMVEVANG